MTKGRRSEWTPLAFPHLWGMEHSGPSPLVAMVQIPSQLVGMEHHHDDKGVVLKLRPLAECSKSSFDHLLSKMGVVETPTPGGKRWLEEIGFPHKLGKDKLV